MKKVDDILKVSETIDEHKMPPTSERKVHEVLIVFCSSSPQFYPICEQRSRA